LCVPQSSEFVSAKSFIEKRAKKYVGMTFQKREKKRKKEKEFSKLKFLMN
jgi:hypothetical protein